MRPSAGSIGHGSNSQFFSIKVSKSVSTYLGYLGVKIDREEILRIVMDAMDEHRNEMMPVTFHFDRYPGTDLKLAITIIDDIDGVSIDVKSKMEHLSFYRLNNSIEVGPDFIMEEEDEMEMEFMG